MLRAHLPVQTSTVAKTRQHVEPRGRLGPGEVVRAETARQRERQQPLGEMRHERRGPDAIGQRGRGLAGAQARELAREVIGAAAEHEPRSYDERRRQTRADEPLPRELGTTVDPERIGLVDFVVRGLFGAVEDVVGRDVHQHRVAGPRGERERLRSLRVIAECPRRIGLTGVDAGERGAVHDQVGPNRGDRAHHRVVVADVEVGMRQRNHVMVRRCRRAERAAEAAAGTGDGDPHATPCGGLGRVTTSTLCARYSHSR